MGEYQWVSTGESEADIGVGTQLHMLPCASKASMWTNVVAGPWVFWKKTPVVWSSQLV